MWKLFLQSYILSTIGNALLTLDMVNSCKKKLQNQIMGVRGGGDALDKIVTICPSKSWKACFHLWESFLCQRICQLHRNAASGELENSGPFLFAVYVGGSTSVLVVLNK